MHRIPLKIVTRLSVIFTVIGLLLVIIGKRSIVGTSTQAAAPYRAAYKSVCFLHSAGSLSDHGSRSSQNPVS